MDVWFVTKSRALLGLVVVLGLLLGLEARALALSPLHLEDMPSPKQVTDTLKGNDPLDTAARQAAAFHQLVWVVRALSAGGEFRDSLTADENALMNVYIEQQSAAEARGKALIVGAPATGPDSQHRRWLEVFSKYDTTFARPELLRQLAPKIETLYLAREEARLTKAKAVARGAEVATLDTSATEEESTSFVGILKAILTLGLLFGLGLPMTIWGALTYQRCMRYEFEHRTAGNVVQFASFEESERHNRRKLWSRFATLAGLALTTCGCFLLIAPLFGLGRWK